MKILIRLPNWLGDVVMSTAFTAAVKEYYPGAEVHVIIKKELSGIAELIPGITIHPFSKQEYKGLSGVYRFGKSLRGEKFDLFFNLPASLSSLVLGWATGANKRIGFAKEGGMFLLNNAYKMPDELHRVDQYLYLLEQFTGKPVTERKVGIDIYLEHEPAHNIVMVNFNSEATSRRMPEEKAKRLLSVLAEAFPDVQFGLIGSPKEKPYVDSLIPVDNVRSDGYPRFLNYAGKTNLPQLAGYMANATAILTTDSGPAHLANAVGRPTIVLFGAGDEHNTAPYNKENLTIIRAGKLACEPCVKNTCKLYGVPKCMELLDELQIINALSVYLRHA
ncbi:MAG TPA: glycosyltransferase family 9 protein [Mucilaginibacter sp.]